MRCLIVDDSAEFLLAATRLLRSQGMNVVGSASSGAEALLLAAKLKPDVLLVDIELGDEDGIELTRQLVASAAGTRVVLISAHDCDALGDSISGSGAVGFLAKSALGATAIAGLAG